MLTRDSHARLQEAARLAAIRVPRGQELDESTARLQKLVDADDVPHLVDRLRVGNGGVVFLAVHEIFALRAGDEDRPWCDDSATNSHEVAYELKAGVRLLQSEENPEALLARRRALIERHEAELVNRRTQLAADREAEAERVRGELLRWRADQWKLVNLIVQMMLAVAFELEATQPETSKALIAIARRADSCGG